MDRSPGPLDPVAAIALLEEPTRRRLYDHVVRRGEAVGRNEAAAAAGISRELAAFHLDRLAAGGLLDVEYRRLGTRRGPGAGRPAKLYRRSSRDLALSLPGRDYARAAEVMAEAIAQVPGGAGMSAVAEVARARGRAAGGAAARGAGRRPGRRRLRASLLALLDDAGYEPQADPEEGTVRLRNCPFHALADSHRELTCGMNLAWAEGVAEGLDLPGLGARLAPAPGRCCVVFDEDPAPDARRRTTGRPPAR